MTKGKDSTGTVRIIEARKEEDPAWEKCQAARQAAHEEYMKTLDTAFEKYQKATADAWAAFDQERERLGAENDTRTDIAGNQ